MNRRAPPWRHPGGVSVCGATSFQTVLRLPALLDGLEPMLAAEVDGDPATAVEQPG